MRGAQGLLGVMLLGACFAPATPAGVVCDPAEPACPSGQRCIASGNGHVCSAHDAGAPADATIVLDAPPNTVSQTYVATIAECVAPSFPGPALCRQLNGNTQLVIDVRDTATQDPWHAYLKFDVDNALHGKTITKVVLRLVATNANGAPGPDSGSVFAVQAFTRGSLNQGVPAQLGALAGNQGAVSAGEVVSWALPTSVVTPGQPVFLGLYANDDDAVSYFNTDGPMPPRLIVDAQ